MEQKVIEDICCELSKDLLGLQFPGKLKVGNYYVSFSEEIVTELISKWVEGFMPDECKENGLKIVGTKKKGGEQELSRHGNRLEQHFRNMACLLVEANKTKKITQNYTDHEEEHNPYLHVLFDFNPEHCLITIEI